MAHNHAETLTLQSPTYTKNRPIWCHAYEADMLDCLLRARNELGAHIATGSILAWQLPVATMMDRPNIFLWQTTQRRAQAFQAKYGLSVQVQVEFCRKMARLQYLKCLSSRTSDRRHSLRMEWQRALVEVMSPDIYNEAFRYCVGQAPPDWTTNSDLVQRRIDDVLSGMQNVRVQAATRRFLEEGPHHPSVVACIHHDDFRRFTPPLPLPAIVDVGTGPAAVDVLIPPDLSSTPFVGGDSQRAAVGAYVGSHLRHTGIDFYARTMDVSDIPLVLIPGTSILALCAEPRENFGGLLWPHRIKHWLSVVALCLMFQIGHSVQRDTNATGGWTELLTRFDSYALLLSVWKRVVPGSDRLSHADRAAALVRLAERMDLEDAEAMILALRPHESALSWLAVIKRAATAPLGSSPTTGSDIFLPMFPWWSDTVRDGLSLRTLVGQAEPILSKLMQCVEECSEPAHAATALQIHYERQQTLGLLCFLLLSSYRPCSRGDWANVSHEVIAQALVQAVRLLDAGMVSIFSISLSHIVSPQTETQILENRSAHRRGLSGIALRFVRRIKRSSANADRNNTDHATHSSSMFHTRTLMAMRRMNMDQTHPDFHQEASQIYVFMGEEFALSPLCRLCTRKMVPRAKTSPYGPGTSLPAMVSLDAIVPRSRGGRYTQGNMQLVDLGCNLVKLNFDVNEAMVMIAHIGAERQLQVDQDGMLCPATQPQVDQATMSTAVVEVWAKKVRRIVPSSGRRRLLSVAQLVRVVVPFMVTETHYRDPSGAVMPLAVASLDRINPLGDYLEENVRPLFIGLNLLRNVCINDASIVAWMAQIPPAAISRGERLRANNVRLPFSDWGDAILRRQMDVNHTRPIPAEASEANEARLEEEEEAYVEGDDEAVGRAFLQDILGNE